MGTPPRSYVRKSAAPTSDILPERWRIGHLLTKERERLNLTLRQLSEKTRSADLEGKGVPHSQIHRIEKNVVIPNLRELSLLATSLKIDLAQMIKPDPVPWFLIRNSTIEQILSEVRADKRKFYRIRGAHEYLIETVKSYRYVPLDNDTDYVIPEEREGDLEPVMRKYVFEVGYAEECDLVKGLASHKGEEIIFVLQGPIEFILQQPNSTTSRRLALNTGDCLQYSSLLKHAYRSTQPGQIARALFFFVEPKTPTGPQFYGDNPASSS